MQVCLLGRIVTWQDVTFVSAEQHRCQAVLERKGKKGKKTKRNRKKICSSVFERDKFEAVAI